MSERTNAVVMLVVLILPMLLQPLLVPRATEEMDPAAYWTFKASPKPAGAWLDDRYVFIVSQLLAGVLVATTVLPALAIERKWHVVAMRRMLVFALAVSVATFLVGLAGLVMHQPLYFWGRFLFGGAFGIAIAGPLYRSGRLRGGNRQS